jgi:hypothetical protein
MSHRTVAKELVYIASLLVGMEFDTKKELDDYKKNHNVKPGTRLTLKKNGPKQTAPKETAPKQTAPNPSTMKKNTHKIDNDTSVRVYDNGGDSIDRYSVVIDGDDWKDSVSSGQVPMLALSEGGRGVSQFTSGKEGKHLGKQIKWEDLDEDTRNHIESRLR